MCGIAGIITDDAHFCDQGIFRRILKSLSHRGPDDHGYLFAKVGDQSVKVSRDLASIEIAKTKNWNLSFVHTRLSIIDTSNRGWQPMASGDGRFAIVLNGEIYNYLELRDELEREGVEFHSQSDTEVLLQSYIRWGTNIFSRLVGMFAFCIWDSHKNQAILCRDSFGIKPLYYTTDLPSKSLAFGSEIETLFCLPKVNRKVSPERLYYYLRHGMTDWGSETMYQSIKQLEPGHFKIIQLPEIKVYKSESYFNLRADKKISISYEDAREELNRKFLNNIKLHLRSDVPVGATLSGGIDSSSIVMAMRKIGGNSLNLHTFSFIPETHQESEETYIDEIVHTSKSISNKIIPTGQVLLDEVETLIKSQEEPFRSTSIYAQRKIFESVRASGIKVVLDGQGADECLAGYSLFCGARMSSLIRERRWSDAIRFAIHQKQISALELIGLTGAYILPDVLQPMFRKFTGKEAHPRWLRSSWFSMPKLPKGVHFKTLTKNALIESLAQSIEINSLPALMRYADRNSMAFALENRVPFLTPDLVQFILSLPESYILDRRGRSKAIFRDSMRGMVPKRILDRKDKIGFSTPEGFWLKNNKNWAENILFGSFAQQLPFLNQKAIRDHWQNVFIAKKKFDPIYWRWINTIEWARLFKVEF